MKDTFKVSLLTIFISLFCQSAFATNKISSPNIEAGRLSVEYRGGYDFDDSPGKNGDQLNKFVMNYGITDRLRPEVKLLYYNRAQGDSKISGMEMSLMTQFFKPQEAWAAASFESYYKPSFIRGISDRLEEKLLFEKSMGNWINNAYLTMEKEIGDDSRPSITLTAAEKTRYKVSTYFQPGAEFYADLHRLDGERRYQVGPIIAGRFDDHITYEAGYLFGASNEATPDGRLKLILTYEWHF